MAQAYVRLNNFLAIESLNGHIARAYTSERLGDIAGEIPQIMLAQLIYRLLGEGKLEQFLRIKTSNGRGISDFKSIAEVPKTIYDSAESLEEIPVLHENIEVTYRLSRRGG